jgi:3-phenylpropionate/cinnamic acid dioxygenase small subunit
MSGQQVPLPQGAVEAFLYREARFADEHRYDEWLALWDEGEVLYWVPCNADDVDPARHISITYDNRSGLEQRIFRFKSPASHSQHPKSRMRRMLSNVEVEHAEGDIRVGANFTLVEARPGRQTMLAGRCEYVLRNDRGNLKIRQKKVLLVNNDDFLGNLTFLL